MSPFFQQAPNHQEKVSRALAFESLTDEELFERVQTFTWMLNNRTDGSNIIFQKTLADLATLMAKRNLSQKDYEDYLARITREETIH